ncbi:hypothetical protein C8T65DRAFT_595699 [Cerioporus squamosus]|nr:hypothetical protein C8T65DRAFT_595699 [Cerioporus squamosus]
MGGVLATVLVIYESFVTLDREVTCFWTAKWTGAPLLFFANKWISMAFYFTTLVSFASFSSDKVSNLTLQNACHFYSCSIFAFTQEAILVLQYLPWAVFSALRAYALSMSKPLGMFILALSLVPAGANLVIYSYHFNGVRVPSFGCFQTSNTNHLVVIISRVPLIVADILLIYITWTKIRGRGALRDLQQSKRMSLSDILFCNGTIYFVIMFILNVLHLTLSVTSVAINNNSWSYVTVFTPPITTILVSRFLLELQEANQTVIRVDPDDPLHFSRNPYDDTPSFISSLGAFINPDVPAPRDDHADSHVDSVRSEPEVEGQGQASQAAVSSSA